MCVNAHAMRKRPQSYELFLNEDGLPWLFFVFFEGKILARLDFCAKFVPVDGLAHSLKRTLCL